MTKFNSFKYKYTIIFLLEVSIPILFFFILKFWGESDPIKKVLIGIGWIVIIKWAIQIVIYYFKKITNKKVSDYISILPKRIKRIFEILLREKIGNDENTFSLFWDFDTIDVQTVKEMNKSFVKDELSLNGLVGDNNQEEKTSTHVTDDEIKKYLEVIEEWRGDVFWGNNHLLENDKEKNEYLKIFTVSNIRFFIKVVENKTKEKGNTFNFIADQYGIYAAEENEKRGCLILYVYKTNYFTFRVMNSLYEKTPILHTIAKRMCLNQDNKAFRKEGFRLLFPFFASLGTNIIIELLSQEKGRGFLIQKRNDKVFGSTSKYHISVNETFSFTDKVGNRPDIPECVRRGIEEELGLDLEEEWKDDKRHKRISYMDIFLNPDRGNLGLSIIYKTDINPSIITYYPGIDKVIEASKHLCVYGINNYSKMLNFISLYNWIVYTPYLLKQYAIFKQGWLDKLIMLWNLDKGEKRFCEKRGLFWVTSFYYVSIVALLLISVYFAIIQQYFIATYICLPIISLWEKKFLSILLKDARKIREKNIDYNSPGDYPYNNVLLYTGIDDIRNLESKYITLALKSSINMPFANILTVLRENLIYDFLPFFEKAFTTTKNNFPIVIEDKQTLELTKITWNKIKIISCQTGVRHVYKDEEYPALILQGYISSSDIEGKKLIVRKYNIERKATELIVYYYEKQINKSNKNTRSNTEDKKISILRFGYNLSFESVFDIRTGEYDKNGETDDVSNSNLSSFAVEVLKNNGFNYFGHLKLKDDVDKDLHLCDIFQSPDKNEIIISSYLEKKVDFDNQVRKIEGDAKSVCDKIINLINSKEYDIDKQDILMLQQILLRKRFNIKLFYPKKENL